MKKKHQHKPQRTTETCACGATRVNGGEWSMKDPVGQSLVAHYLANSTHQERSANALKASEKRWKGKTRERDEYMRQIAQRPRPSREVKDRCACGLYSKKLAEKRKHICRLPDNY